MNGVAAEFAGSGLVRGSRKKKETTRVCNGPHTSDIGPIEDWSIEDALPLRMQSDVKRNGNNDDDEPGFVLAYIPIEDYRRGHNYARLNQPHTSIRAALPPVIFAHRLFLLAELIACNFLSAVFLG